MIDSKTHAMYSSLRLAKYKSRWGNPVQTWERTLADNLIHFHLFKIDVEEGSSINNGKSFFALFTDGLSDQDYAPDAERTEFVIYVDEMKDVYLEWLGFLAIVHMTDSVDLFHKSIPMSCPPSNLHPLSENSVLDHAFVTTPVLTRDQTAFQIGGTETFTLWVVPISANEKQHVKDKGIDGLMTLFQKTNTRLY